MSASRWLRSVMSGVAARIPPPPSAIEVVLRSLVGQTVNVEWDRGTHPPDPWYTTDPEQRDKPFGFSGEIVLVEHVGTAPLTVLTDYGYAFYIPEDRQVRISAAGVEF